MAVVAPKVEYYRLVDDGTNSGTYKFVDDKNAATLLDFGTVDAGSDSHLDKTIVDAAAANADPAGYQAFAIFNAKGESTDHSDMQNSVVGVVNNEVGHEGNKDGVVYEQHWIHVLMNAETDDVSLGFDKETSSEVTKTLTAIGLDPAEAAGTIKGSKNDGTLLNAQNNYARILTWVSLPQNAAAGPHYFRLRTTYSYT